MSGLRRRLACRSVCLLSCLVSVRADLAHSKRSVSAGRFRRHGIVLRATVSVTYRRFSPPCWHVAAGWILTPMRVDAGGEGKRFASEPGAILLQWLIKGLLEVDLLMR